MTSADVFVPATTAAADEEWRRLNAKMLLVHPVREFVKAIPLLFFIVLAGSGSGSGSLWGLIGVGFVIALSISRWFTTRYRIGADQVQIREGLLRRRVLAARLDRVRTVDITSHFLHRVLGLARVEIGTGVSDRKGKSSLRLDGLTAVEAAGLRAELLHRSHVDLHPATAAAAPAAAVPMDVALPRAEAAYQPDEVEIARFQPSWIRFAPFTLSGVFTALAVLGFGWRLVSESQVDVSHVGPVQDVADQLDRAALAVAVAEVALGVLVFVALASTARYVLTYWDFKLTRHEGGTFHVSRGLLTTRATSIDVDRLRGVAITQPLPLRLIGGARTAVIATGLDMSRGAAASGRSSTALLPDAPLAEARRVAGVVTGQPSLAVADLVDHGPVARRRRYTRAVGAALLLAVAADVVWWLVGWRGIDLLLPLVLVVAAVPLARDRAASLGHLVRDGFVITQNGSLSRRRASLESDAVIGWNLHQSWFQRRAGVATLVATTAAGRQGYRLLDLPLAEARRVIDAATPSLLTSFSG